MSLMKTNHPQASLLLYSVPAVAATVNLERMFAGPVKTMHFDVLCVIKQSVACSPFATGELPDAMFT